MKATAPFHEEKKSSTGLLAFGALGVVFGDIGTSPLYALQSCFAGTLPPTPDNVLGFISLILWGLLIVVAIKYVYVVMNASNRGEGGILALTSLAAGSMRHLTHGARFIPYVGFFGAALFLGDSVITPAVSVLSAVEGLKIAAPRLEAYVLPISVSILVVLFLFQRFGTKKVGNYFGPIMTLWFVSIAFLGFRALIDNPEALKAFNPYYGLSLLAREGAGSLGVLGYVILAFTGAEALYADMGHFGARPIRLSWFVVVFPALVLNYLGQGALLLNNPEAASNPFYLLVPDAFQAAMVVLASLATVIASQAVISGAFSLTQQAIQLGYLPRMEVLHTSASQFGQIYVPRMNWLLCAGVLLLIAVFRSSSALADAYGFAVSGTMLATTLLVLSVAKHIWCWPRWQFLSVMVPLFLLDFALFCATITKIPDGGWLPLLIGSGLFIIFLTWHQGRDLIMKRRRGTAQKLETFVENLEAEQIPRVGGTAVYLSTLRAVVPTTMINNLRHNKVLHERVIVLHIRNEDAPRVPEEHRLSVKRLPHGFWQVSLHYGFMERPNVMEDLHAYLLADCPIEMSETSFFIGHDVFVAGEDPLKPFWREMLFLWLANGASGMSEYFRIPPERVVSFGIQVRV